jgi:hypothetical protein
MIDDKEQQNILYQKIKNVIVDDISRKTISSLFSLKKNPDENYYRDSIVDFYHRGILDNKSLEKGIESAIFNEAEIDYKVLYNNNNNSDKVSLSVLLRPECLAYAIKKNLILSNPDNVDVFKRESVDSFLTENYKENLPSLYREKYLNFADYCF